MRNNTDTTEKAKFASVLSKNKLEQKINFFTKF